MKTTDFFTQIPNKILEALIRTKLSGSEFSVVLTICRDTYGWQVKAKTIGYTGFAKQTDLPRSYVISLVKKLKQSKVIVKYKGEGYAPNSYSINEEVENWAVEFRNSQSKLTSLGTLISKERLPESSQSKGTFNSPSGLTQEINSKESKKRTENIKQGIRERFRGRRGNEIK